jgi:cellulose biosynthesis protein BcsQ
MEMKKRYVDIVDADLVYVMRLQRYIRSDPQWRDRLVLRGASSVDKLRALLEERVPDLVLVSPQWIDETARLGLACPVAELAERPDSAGAARHIAKYQPVPELLERLMAFSAAAAGSRAGSYGRGGEPSTRVVAVYSPAGGSGKSTLCLHLMRVWLREGRRVIYVNLETLASEALFGDGDWDRRSARFVYMLEHQPAQFRNRWRETVARHAEFGFDMLPPILHLHDGMHMSEQAAARCLTILRESGEYDIVLVDLDSGCNERIAGAFRAADDIVWLETLDAVGMDKSRRMMSGIRRLWREDGEAILRKIVHVRHRVPAGSAAARRPAHAVASASAAMRSAAPQTEAAMAAVSVTAGSPAVDAGVGSGVVGPVAVDSAANDFAAVPKAADVESPLELPDIPEWKQAPGWSAIWKHDAYNEAVARLNRAVWAGSA